MAGPAPRHKLGIRSRYHKGARACAVLADGIRLASTRGTHQSIRPVHHRNRWAADLLYSPAFVSPERHTPDAHSRLARIDCRVLGLDPAANRAERSQRTCV